ncbi:iron transporter FeoC [Vibrio sp. HA2012]|uniref:FeoC-like transcriptional regulator n=1 Tax=Vibrio sp. HA2012 TaxID=1971595 RepID=UPI000C2C46FD|nr:FeoC-like transcriptional regulator [Vibrio sp. HA2012]PJC87631.1 iron transporter FeoC [Vibrio sp. HA2012]
MIISELKEYIQQHQGVSRDELARHFALSEDGVEAMLGIWIRKGKLSQTIELDKRRNIRKIRYHWNEPDQIPLTIIQ